MCWAMVLGNFLRRWPHSSKSSGRFKSKAHPLDFRKWAAYKAACFLDFFLFLLISASLFILSLTPGKFWPLPVCQIFCLLHFKSLLSSLTHFLLTSWTQGPHSPMLKLRHSGEKAKWLSCTLCSHLVKPRRCAWMHGDLADDCVHSGQEHLTLSQSMSLFFFRTSPVQYLFRFSTWTGILQCLCRSQRLREGKRIIHPFRKTNFNSWERQGLLQAHRTLWKELSRLSVACGWRVGSQQRDNEVLLCKGVLPPVKYFSGKQISTTRRGSQWSLGSCCALVLFFFPTSIEMQLELKSTPIINYVERMRTVVKIKPTNLYFSLFLSSCFYMLQSWLHKTF